MRRVYFGLYSTEGDRLGHLIRGVQMLRSYGSEADIDQYSGVINLALRPDEPPAFACVVSGPSAATPEGLAGICRETQWALGDRPERLSVFVLGYGHEEPATAPPGLWSVGAGRFEPGMVQVLGREEFARLCDWGQQLIGDEADVMGEWPSATGR